MVCSLLGRRNSKIGYGWRISKIFIFFRLGCVPDFLCAFAARNNLVIRFGMASLDEVGAEQAKLKASRQSNFWRRLLRIERFLKRKKKKEKINFAVNEF